jgi:hypothetical protein
LLYKSQEETDPLGNVPKNAPDEESVKSTANKDNGNSKASSSNVKDAPSPDKGGVEEGMLLSLCPIDSYTVMHLKTDSYTFMFLYLCLLKGVHDKLLVSILNSYVQEVGQLCCYFSV